MRKVTCLNYNANSTAYALSLNSYLIIEVRAIQPKKNHSLGKEPVFLQLYDQTTIPNILRPSLTLGDDTSNYILLSVTEFQYLNSSVVKQFDPLLSSTPTDDIDIKITMVISFSTTLVTAWQQGTQGDISLIF
jgi:hypothetical protein